MYDAVDLVRWISVRCCRRRLKATTLFDCHVHDYGTFAHRAQHILAHQFGSGRSRNEHCPDDHVGVEHLFLHGVDCRKSRTNAPAPGPAAIRAAWVATTAPPMTTIRAG